MDWTGCELVERVPGRCSGVPTVVGTRIFPDTVVDYFDSGSTIDQIREDYPSLAKETISGLIEYVKMRRSTAA